MWSDVYVFGVPPPKKIVVARNADADVTSASSAVRYRSDWLTRCGHFAKSQYGQIYGQNGR